LTTTTKISLCVTNQSQTHNLGLELLIDNVTFLDNNVTPGKHHFVYKFSNDLSNHVFKAVLKNKQDYHTKINEHGKILEDALITISDVVIDGINVDSIMHSLARYTHDGNGQHETRTDIFYGIMGCNGYVQLNFSTPVNIWALETL